MTPRPPILLVDGSYYAHRGHHAYPRMTADGEPTGAIYGLANALAVLEERYGPETPGVVAFAGPQTFRTAQHEGYRGHRPEAPEEVRRQWEGLHALARAYGYAVVDTDGYEPLDLFAARVAAAGEVAIAGGDRRYRGLLREGVELARPLADAPQDAASVEAELGTAPRFAFDVVALSGDSSAGIPGLPGIGEKTAAQLVARYGDLDAVLEAAARGEVPGKRGQTLLQGAEDARRWLALAQPQPERCEHAAGALDAPRRADIGALRALFTRWQFRAHLTLLAERAEEHPPERSDNGDSGAIDRDAYRTVSTLTALDEALAAARAAGRVSVDLETTSLDPLAAKVVGVALCWSARDAVYVPLAHRAGPDGARADGQPALEGAWERLSRFFSDARVPKIGQNLKYDCAVLAAQRVTLAGIAGDTMLADYVLEPDQIRHGLDDLALRHLGHETIKYHEVTGGRPDEISFADVAIDRATRYAAEDAHVAWLLDRKLTAMLAERELTAVYRDLEVPLVPVLAAMESAGIGVDVPALRALSTELVARMREIEREIYALAEGEFNINSPKQLAEILFERRGLEPIRRTKSGYSTDADTLEQLAAIDPLPERILAYRTLAKLEGTYVSTLPDAVSPVDGRIHTSFHQAVAATGRLSSNNPNLQNIPIRTEDGRRIRACFVAAPGHVFVSLDYSQVELRVLAHYCATGPLVEAFARGEDIHRRTAAEIFGVELDAVTAEQRRSAKAINFGIVYGMGAHRLANDLRISRKEAAAFLDRYFARLPEVARVQRELVAEARSRGYSKTLFGRQRPIPDLSATSHRARSAAERVALNSPIQGTAADIIKRAMVSAHRGLLESGLDARLLLQVHDELLLEVRRDQAGEATALVRHAMEGAAELAVPLLVQVGVGESWDEAH